mgnify:CR=1 FL=1
MAFSYICNMGRPFNKKAYDSFDSKNKKELVNMMTAKGYALVGSIETEHFKKYDVKFTKDGQEISFENETRLNFVTIRDVYETIHIPIRKENTQADYYIVWKPELDEFFMIDKAVIEKYKKEVVTILCNESHVDDSYIDSFIDIPKKEAVLYHKKGNKWKIKNKHQQG